jgi:hypothetical protein
MKKKNKDTLEPLPLHQFHDIFDFVDAPKVVKEEPIVKRKWADTPEGRIITAIKKKIHPDLMDDQEVRRAFNTFRTMQLLSMNEDNIELLDVVNETIGCLDSVRAFRLLYDLIPKGNTFDKFISTKRTSNEKIEAIANHYEVSQREARQYIADMGDDWAQEIIDLKTEHYGKKRKVK